MSAGVTFAYRAAQSGGTVERGTLTADTLEAARAALVARGLFPIEVRAAAAPTLRRPSLSADDIATGLRTLGTLVDSGLPLGRALSAMDDLAPPSWQAGLPALRESVRAGQSLAAAFQAGELTLPPVLLGLIQAGEGGSGLAPALIRAAELAEQTASTRRSIRAALAYPALLLASGGLSIVVLVAFVLPRFTAILADLGQALPPTTRLVLGAAEAVRAGWVPGLGALLVVSLVGHAWVTRPEGRESWHAFLLTVPGIAPIRRSAAVSRYSGALSALLESGVPIAPALTHAAHAAGDAAIARRVLAARKRVVAGAGLGSALEAERASTPTAVRLVRAGEETGRLAAMLAQTARLESQLAESRVRSAVRALEPALVVGFGACVALVAAALLQAVYSVRPSP